MWVTLLFWITANTIMIFAETPVALSALINTYICYVSFVLLSKEI